MEWVKRNIILLIFTIVPGGITIYSFLKDYINLTLGIIIIGVIVSTVFRKFIFNNICKFVSKMWSIFQKAITTISGSGKKNAELKREIEGKITSLETKFNQEITEIRNEIGKSTVQTLKSPDPPNTFRDSRDNRLYRTVQIGDRIWLAENFDYKGDGTVGRYYNDNPELGKIYGRLYIWDEAMRIAPLGWSLPKMVEWTNLIHSTGKENAGYRLKTKEGWDKGENGTDDYGFSALPGGYLSTGENEFSLIGSRAAWWVNSSRFEKTYVKFIENKGNDCYIADYEDYKINMFSVRYVKDRAKSW